MRQQLFRFDSKTTDSAFQSTSPTREPEHPLLELQAAIGNRATNQAIATQPQPNSTKPKFQGLSQELARRWSPTIPIQAKLTIGQPNDLYEQEADRIAEQVVRQINAPESAQQSEPLQRQGTKEGDNKLQTKPLPQNHSEGIPATPELESAIERSRGGGQTLPKAIREPMEQGFGANFSSVRIHTNTHSDQLNQSIQATAFTARQNIFFRKGAYQPENKEGKQLIAHELAHVVQQSGRQLFHQPRSAISGEEKSLAFAEVAPITTYGISGKNHTIQRKLNLSNTRWQDVKGARVSKGGARGVAFVTDDPNDPKVQSPQLVVKAGEEAEAEAVLAANLHNMAYEDMNRDATIGFNTWSVKAPRARTVASQESSAIYTELNKIFTGSEARERNFLASLSTQAGVMLYEFISGKDATELLLGTDDKVAKYTQKSKFKRWQRKERSTSPLRLFFDDHFIYALGRVAFIDIFLGNFDRLIGAFNPQNFMLNQGEKIIQLVDNIQMNSVYAFKDYNRINKEQSLQNWKTKFYVMHLKDRDYTSIATEFWQEIEYYFTVLGHSYDNSVKKEIRSDDIPALKQIVPGYKDKFIDQFTDGLKAGRSELQHLLEFSKSEDSLYAGIDRNDKKQVEASVNARYSWLFG